MFTTLCFFTPDLGAPRAEAAVVNTGNATAFYVPETIYLYPDVTSWTETVKAPFQYYVNNTVDTENIYSAPVAEARLDGTGKIYFAAHEGMSDVNLSVKFLDASGVYIDAADYGTVNFTSEDKGGYYEFTVTDGTSPALEATETGCYIEWCLTYKCPTGEEKAVFNYSYIYKPYVVPYGAAARINNKQGEVLVYGQTITWVTGVHFADNTAAQKNTLYPRYMPVSSAYDSTERGEYPFSPFLSKDNKAYAGSVEVSGAAPVRKGDYNAVFAGTDADTAYFWANQSGARFTRSYRVREFFYTAQTDATYPVAFDYMNNESVAAVYAVSQVTPTRIGTITVDVSRYGNLKEIPNLAVGMMVTDTDVVDAVTSNERQAEAQWYVGDASGRAQMETGEYNTQINLDNARNTVGVKFASEKSLTAPLENGIFYAGAWDRELNSGTGMNTYTVKSYYEAEDRESNLQAVSSSLNLNVNQVDKSALREAVNNAASYFSVLGAKANRNSYYYDLNASDWNSFMTAYSAAARALGNVEFSGDIEALTNELNTYLSSLLSGKGMRVYFDVNYDDIGINLWINPESPDYKWDAAQQTVTIDGEISSNVTYGTTAFTPDAGDYTVSITQLSGSFNGFGCVVLDASDADGTNVLNAGGTRYNVDFKGNLTRTVNYPAADFLKIETFRFWTWYNTDAGSGVYDDFTFTVKIEKGNTATAYSPVGKVTGSTYGTLPVPQREGYVFSGWCTDETLENAVDESSAVSARILYARWEKAQYNVVFDGNGADGGEMPEQTLVYDETAVLNTNTLTRTGYVFSGWLDAEGNAYADGCEVLNLTGENQGKFTLYAQWTPNQYSVAFDGNTGLGGLGMTNAQYDTPFSLPANYFIKTGYSFIGWSTSPDGEVLYGDKAEVSNLTSDVNGSVTLYAIWKANTFSVKFDANGAEGTMADASVVYDSGATVPECGFVKTGYSFVGWSLDKEGTEIITEVQYDNLCTEEGDTVTVYAIWSENSYTLNLDKNGGTGTNISATRYKYEDTVILPMNVFSKTGYVLAGWSLEKNGTVVYGNGAAVQHINADKNGSVTLWAVWTPIEYTVRFDANTGDGSMADITMIYDAYTPLPDVAFTKEGYHFLGWATSASGGVSYSDKQSVKNLASAEGAVVTLYAVWEINSYNVSLTYFNNKGDSVTANISVQHGSPVALPADFTKTPYYNYTSHRVFSEWSADISSVTSDMTVVGIYSSELESHTLDEEAKESTCSVAGYDRSFCTKCSYSTSVPRPLKEHTYDSGVVSVEPGCTTNGTMLYTCTVCSATRGDTIAPTGHSFVAFDAKEPTCSEEGNIAHKHCERCAKCFANDALENAPDSAALTDEQVKLAKLPHTPGAEADCTNDQLCTVCFEVITEKLGHTEKIEYITSEATCTQAGDYVKRVTCTVCNTVISTESLNGTVPHVYTEKETAPTCTEEGYVTYTCSVCGDSYKAVTEPEKGHTEGEWVVTKEPTCTENGEETNYCSECSSPWKTRDVDSQGHDSGEWVEVTPAQCEVWGEESLNCTKCGESIAVRGISPKGHGEVKYEITVVPGCETAGRNSKICVDCGKELSFTVIPEKGHIADGAATCEKDSVCTGCGIVLTSKLGHKWDEGVVTKEPTETATGIRTYTCLNDNTHTYEETIPVRIVIVLPEITEFDAPETGFIGNVHNMITVEEGMEYTVTCSDSTAVTMDENGNLTAVEDGTADITVTTADGRFTKTFTVTVRTLKSVYFDVRGVITEIRAYVGDTVTAPQVDSYTQGNFTYRFKSWTVDGIVVNDFTVTGEKTFVAVFTSSCDYSLLDKLSEVFFVLISGSEDNATKLKIYKTEIETARAEIERFSKDRDTRDVSEQSAIDALTNELSALISKIYPDNQGRLFITTDSTVGLGSITEFTAFLSPINTIVTEGIWTSSDDSIGFFIGNKFHAVKAGTVTVTISSGVRTASKEITVSGSTAARVIMFDALVSGANYIVEGSLVITETTNMFWSPDVPVHFRVIMDGTFEEYYVYVNDKKVTPAADGTYTIDAGTGDAHIRVEGVLKDADGTKLSFWEMILDFFRRIGDFFRNLFS